MGREKGAGVRLYQREHVREREALERRFGPIVEEDDSLALLVTGDEARFEPFHRWHAYRQQFSPGLVQRFLAEAFLAPGPVLDPFSGSATTVLACARENIRAVGIDGLEVLAHLAVARFLDSIPPLPELDPAGTLAGFWRELEHPAHRAAVLLAATRTVAGDGKAKRAGPHAALLADVWRMMREDLVRPLPKVVHIAVGDARALPLDDHCIGGICTSPPYLSRYDYRRIMSPVEQIWSEIRPAAQPVQLAATVKSGRKPAHQSDKGLHPAVIEAAQGLVQKRRAADADVVRAYFRDLGRFLLEAKRVLRPEAPAWIVIGGADIEREYIPSDLIVAEMAQEIGFTVEVITQARVLRESRRHLGKLDEVAPRESVVKLRAPEAA